MKYRFENSKAKRHIFNDENMKKMIHFCYQSLPVKYRLTLNFIEKVCHILFKIIHYFKSQVGLES